MNCKRILFTSINLKLHEKFTPDKLAHKIGLFSLNLSRVYHLKSISFSTQQPLFFAWIITSTVVILLCISLFLSLKNIHWQHPSFSPEDLILWRTGCYISAILLLPIANLLRYVFLRLNQTMPPLKPIQNLSKLASARYTLTVTISQSIMLLIGGFGAMMFLLGDSVNTLYILSSVAGLGIFLYRPKITEYHNIVDSLTQLETQNESN